MYFPCLTIMACICLRPFFFFLVRVLIDRVFSPIGFRNNGMYQSLIYCTFLIDILSPGVDVPSTLFCLRVVMAAQPIVNGTLGVLDAEPFFSVSFALYDSALGSAYLRRLTRFDYRRSREFAAGSPRSCDI